MGTNYYLVKKGTEEELAVLEKFGMERPRLHIGKSSCGWQFLFYSPNFEEMELFGFNKIIRSLHDWVDVMNREWFDVIDEYGETVPVHELLDIIENKREGLNHLEECMKDEHSKEHVIKECFTDGAGNPFCCNEFS